jgi:hypothetical protein
MLEKLKQILSSVVLLRLFCDLLFSVLSGYILKNVQCTVIGAETYCEK